MRCSKPPPNSSEIFTIADLRDARRTTHELVRFAWKNHKLRKNRTRSSQVDVKRLANDLLLLLVGVRTSVLMDHGLTDPECDVLAKAICESPRLSKFDGIRSFRIQDYATFLVHVPRLQKRLEAVDGERTRIVDVSAGLTSPTIVSDSVEQRWIPQLQTIFTAATLESRPEIITLEPESVVSVAGWLLDYPVVYKCGTGNNLSRRPLHLISCLWKELEFEEHSPILQFSIPVDCGMDTLNAAVDELTRRIDTRLDSLIVDQVRPEISVHTKLWTSDCICL